MHAQELVIQGIAIDAVIAIAGHRVFNQRTHSDGDEADTAQCRVAACIQVKHKVLVQGCRIDPVHAAVGIDQVHARALPCLCLQGQDLVGVVVNVVHTHCSAKTGQFHRIECSGLAQRGVLYAQGPGACHLFAAQPVQAKCVGQTQIRGGRRACRAVVNVHAGARWGDQLNTQLREIGMGEVQAQGDVLQGHVLRDRKVVGQGAGIDHGLVGTDHTCREGQLIGRGLGLWKK